MKIKIPTIIICILILGASTWLITKNLKVEVELEPTIETTTTETTTTTVTTKVTTKKTTKVNTNKKKEYSSYKVATASKAEYMAYAKSVGGYNDTQMQCLDWLWTHESGWNPNSHNTKTDCCGIPQSHPCSKIKKQQGSMDWQAQIRWGVNYIAYRYNGNPCSAWNHFKNSKPHGY